MSESGKPLRLALVANRIQRNDGQGRVNYEIAKAALEDGMHVTLLAAHCAEDLLQQPRAQWVRLGNESLPTQMLKNLSFASQTAKWLRKHRASLDVVRANGFITWESADVVAMHFVHTCWYRSSFYPFKGSLRPYVLYQRAYTALNSRWEQRALRSARRVVAVSDVVKREVASLGVPPERIQTIFNGVDVEEFRPGLSERAKWSLPEQVPLGLFVGDIRSPRKNLATVLHAMQQIPELHLAVAGDLEGSPAPALARELGIAERVHFVGKTSAVSSLMRSADLFVFASLYETYGLVVLEAAASGLPILVSKNVGAAEALDGVLALLQDPKDVQALARSLRDFLDSPERARELGVKARERSLQLSWKVMADNYLSMYKTLAREVEK